MWRTILVALLAACALAAQPKPGDSSIEGHVLSLAGGVPIKKATVTLTGRPDGEHLVRLTADTDGDGKFQFINLPAGTYRLSARRPGFQDHSARSVFSVGVSDHVIGAEIRLPQKGAISGRVLDEDGDLSPNATLNIFRQGYRNGLKHWYPAIAGINATENGEYRIPNLAPGRYILLAQSRRPESDNRYDDGDWRSKSIASHLPTYYNSSPDEQSALPVDVGIGADIRGIDIRLIKIVRQASPLYHVRGLVAGMPPDLDGYVSIGLLATDRSRGGMDGLAIARAPDYAFDLTVRPGEYTIRADVSFHNAPAGPPAYGRGSVSVTGDMSGVVIEMRPAPEIAGRISVAENGVQVLLEGVDVELQGTFIGRGAKTDSAGRFTIYGLEPDNYWIQSISPIPDSCYVREVRFGGQEVSWDGFEISAPGHLEVVLSTTAGQIAGTVSDVDGKLFPISTVTIIPADGKSRPSKQAVKDDGTFRFVNLRPGTYKLLAWEEIDDDLWPDPDFRKKYEGQAVDVAVAPRGTQTVHLRVIPFEAIK